MVDITRTVRGSIPRLPFEDMARHVLGTTYELSLVICGDKLAQRINSEYRKKTYYPNVLSFPLAKNEGEMFLNIRKAEREAHSLGVSVRERTALLYVHGLWHLKGHDHSDTMEKRERETLRAFGL
ncbi:rRNA maturation RNase YbeY [Candidatus Kaiserbacteria bacterium]|nr:rRNA maturation RNase YbeY [Candidatus Kaiserbacteria bacterium]